MIILSTMSIAAGNCNFEEEIEESPVLYLIFLLYFRTYGCADSFVWKELKIKNSNESILDFMPRENGATRRTQALSAIYLIFNILLLVSSLLLLGE